jgi:hypothetical protein
VGDNIYYRYRYSICGDSDSANNSGMAMTKTPQPPPPKPEDLYTGMRLEYLLYPAIVIVILLIVYFVGR